MGYSYNLPSPENNIYSVKNEPPIQMIKKEPAGKILQIEL